MRRKSPEKTMMSRLEIMGIFPGVSSPYRINGSTLVHSSLKN
jgi:hypothetical protein